MKDLYYRFHPDSWGEGDDFNAHLSCTDEGRTSGANEREKHL